MTIQDGPGGIHHGILLIVPFRQHRIEGAEAAIRVGAVAGPLHQLGQHAED